MSTSKSTQSCGGTQKIWAIITHIPFVGWIAKKCVDAHRNKVKIIGKKKWVKKCRYQVVGANNSILNLGGHLKNCKIVIVGTQNELILSEDTNIENCTIYFTGSNNKIFVGKQSKIQNSILACIENENVIQIGDSLTASDKMEIYAIEGKKITIGSDCLFSYGIEIRNSDSHSLFDQNGDRINEAKDVVIGDHVWICQHCLILKGAEIGSGSCVAAKAVVTGKTFDQNTLIGGFPARVLREGITWRDELVKTSKEKEAVK